VHPVVRRQPPRALDVLPGKTASLA
jgi:hypothetical protein